MDKENMNNQQELNRNQTEKEAKQLSYHIKYDKGSRRIYAGKLSMKGTRWLSASDATDEALSAVRDYLEDILEKQEEGTTAIGYQWERTDGKYVSLQFSVLDCK